MGTATWQDRLEVLKHLVPDPCKPVQLGGPVTGDTRSRWVAQRQRRSSILSSARQLVAEKGLDHVHMQSVAHRSGVSIQTLYNVVGHRAELLASAASEWMIAIAGRAEELGDRHDVNVTFTTIELFWGAAVANRQYSCNLIRAQAQHGMLERPFVLGAEAIFNRQLRTVAVEGALVRWVDIPLLARQLATSSHAFIRDWLMSPYDEGYFRSSLVNGCGLLLRGALQGEAVHRLERALDGHCG